ncbi:MAG: MarR family winged helix-turn-helix transcriptional regulator [Thermonemataceae bacterium]
MNFKDTIGRYMGMAHILFQKNLEEALKARQVPITAEQFKMMSRLWQQEGISQRELAKGVGRNRAAAGRMIDTLEKKGLLQRHDHPNDRRLKLIFLTKLGKQIQKKAEESAKEVLEKSTQSLSEEEKSTLKKLLKEVIENLS